MARRSFSLMLAWRYLNPRRAMLSAVTLISVTGVLLGVLVLVVVMSVMAGLEKEVKERFLGFTPHVRLEYMPFGGFREPLEQWRETAEAVKKVEGVQGATAFMQDYALVDVDSRQRPAFFRGVDTDDTSQVEGITAMLDQTEHPGSSADMGLDDRIVISSIIAKQFDIGVGGKMSLYSARNFEQVKHVYDITSRPPLREEFAPLLANAKEMLAKPWEKRGEQLFLADDAVDALYIPLYEEIYRQDVRDPEKEIIGRVLKMMDEAGEAEGGLLFAADTQAQMLAILAELDETNVEEMDAAILKGIKELVLPKEATVIGVYQASQMALTPDIFMPLPLAQELAGMKGAVQGISVRLHDPYHANQVAQTLVNALPPGWRGITWTEELGDFSRLIAQQRMMMYFALSFIILVSAFSMMAVMFTVTIQKRREIGVMKALGAAPGQIVRVFVHQGMILGFVGALLGSGLGLLVIRFRGNLQEVLRHFGFDPFSSAFLGFDVLPAQIKPEEIVVVAISSFLLCSFAAFVPAFFAARSDAAKSLRNL
ncbi:ABC transporter permease [Luteolibacter flavescens]|uniref:ABC transporter permease n=1 Tax=Luteolibacter flavescens TaxID=1859460 RepID=A0ABT3FK03_9BACT|nr:FtsX-like permease family protein [Luteolibacter flavescens]MCW1883899.1 ABC transporter permease [Luteolibacter flavescens]